MLSIEDFALTVSLFAPGLVFFTLHFMVLRGLYALERTRTVFWIQCTVAGTNVVLAAFFAGTAEPAEVAPGLAVAYDASYLVGATVSYAVLRNALGGLDSRRFVRFLARIVLVAAVAALGALGTRELVDAVWSPSPSGLDGKAQAVTVLALVGLLDVLVVALLAKALRISELSAIVSMMTRRSR